MVGLPAFLSLSVDTSRLSAFTLGHSFVFAGDFGDVFRIVSGDVVKLGCVCRFILQLRNRNRQVAVSDKHERSRESLGCNTCRVK